MKTKESLGAKTRLTSESEPCSQEHPLLPLPHPPPPPTHTRFHLSSDQVSKGEGKSQRALWEVERCSLGDSWEDL